MDEEVRALIRSATASAHRQLLEGRQRVIDGMVPRFPEESSQLMKVTATDICRLPITVSACTT